MKKHFIIAALFALLMAGTAFAQDKPQDTYQRIATARGFSIGPVGLIRPNAKPGLPPVEKALCDLIRAKDEKSLLELTRESNTAAQMYGLLGLHYLGSREQQTVAGSLAKSSEKVTTISGCLISHRSVSTVAAQVAQGWYDKILKQDLDQSK